MAIATGMHIAAQQALATLVASNRENVGAAAAAKLARADMVRVLTRSRLLATRPVSATKTGELRAYATAKTVTRCPAVPTETERSLATPGKRPVTIKVPVLMAKVARAKTRARRFAAFWFADR